MDIAVTGRRAMVARALRVAAEGALVARRPRQQLWALAVPGEISAAVRDQPARGPQRPFVRRRAQQADRLFVEDNCAAVDLLRAAASRARCTTSGPATNCPTES